MVMIMNYEELNDQRDELESEIVEEDKAAKNETSEVNLDFNKPFSPLVLPEIVENVLKCCSQNDIVNCRIVSHLWNEEAIVILTKTPDLHLQCHDINRLLLHYSKEKTLPNLCDLLNSSENPQILLKNVKISRDYWDTSSRDITEHLSILKRYGKYVKILTIDETHNFDFLKNCLGPTAFCPNVEKLKFKLKFFNFHNSDEIPLPHLDQVETLGLKEFSFEDMHTRIHQNYVRVILRILQKCHEIHTLHLKIKSSTERLFIEYFQSAPHFTKKLKELYIYGNIWWNFKELSQIEFSPKFRKIRIHQSTFLESRSLNWNDDKKEEIKFFLVRFSESLESLEFELADKSYFDILMIIPLMPKLKKLKIWLKFTGGRYVYSDFLKNVPLLRELHLDRIPDFHEFVESYLENSAVAGSSNYVPKFVHQYLEKIILPTTFIYNNGGSDLENWQMKISSPTTIKMLNAVFPNFSELKIKLILPHGSWLEGEKLWFEQFFCAVSKMKSLRILNIHLGLDQTSELNYGILDLKLAFAYFKEMQSLKELHLWGFNIEDCQILWLEHLKALIDAPRLCTIAVFCSLPMNDESVKAELRKIVNEFAAKNKYIVFPSGVLEPCDPDL